MSKKSKNQQRKKQALKARRRRGFKAFIICLIVFCALAAAARLTLYTVVKMESGVIPGYRKGDIAVVSKLPMWSNDDFSEGQVVYADFGGGETSLARKISGVAGDYLDDRGDEIVLIHNCGNEIREESLGKCAGLVNGTIPNNAYLLLGDDSTADGRALGLVYKTDIKGICTAVIWPLTRMGVR